MKRPLLTRILALGLLFLLFLVPLGMVSGLVYERQQRGEAVASEIADSTFREQVVSGPFLVLPYRRTVQWVEVTVADGKRSEQWKSRTTSARVYLPPDVLDVQGSFRVETRKRQLYATQLLHADAALKGTFTIPARAALERGAATKDEIVSYEWQQPYLVVGVADARGIRNVAGTIGRSELEFRPGAAMPWLAGGVHAYVGARVGSDAAVLPYELDLAVSGTSSLGWLPTGNRTEVRLSGEWPHPSFFGQQLPVSHAETNDRFNAFWQTTHFASGITREAIDACSAEETCAPIESRAFGVRLVDPVDRYLLSERTLKYAQLFLLLTFGACFFTEVLKRVRVHPVQYALVGAAQALFFLLTLSLAEHIDFRIGYLVAAAATTGLLTYYGSAVLGGWRRGLGFGGVVALLYGLLFGILQSEDYALLMGALGLLAALTVVMVLTRRIDWYRLGETAGETGAETAG